MRRKAIIPLIMIVAMVLSTTIALADSYTFNTGSLASNGWTITSGTFGGSFGSAGAEGVYSTVTGQGYSRAVHAMNLNPNGTHAFDVQFRFRVNNRSEGIWLGVANSSSGATTGNQLVVGYPGYGSFVTSVDGTAGTTQSMSPTATPDNTTQYVAHVSSNDGNTITLSIETTTQQVVAGPVTRTMPGGRAAYIVLQINNRGPITGTPSANSNPAVYWVHFDDNGGSGSTSTPTPTPTVTPTPAAQGTLTDAYLAGIRDFYANQPVVHMSNESVVYYPNGSIKQVIVGNQTAATPTTGPVVTATPNATVASPTPVPPTATPMASAAAPTKTQSPGFEIILAAIGMMSALVLITRKKK